MALKLSASIDVVRLHLQWIQNWVQSDKFCPYVKELRLLRRISICLEIFFLKDSTTQSEEDETLESFLNRLGVAINEKQWEIYPIIQGIKERVLEPDFYLVSSLLFSFDHVMEILRPLFKKAVDKYLNSSQSKHYSMEKLLDFIQLLSQEGNEIHEDLGSDYMIKPEFFKSFIRFVAPRVEQDRLQDLLARTEAMVIVVTHYSYLMWSSEKALDIVTDGDIQLYDDMQNFSLQFREAYIRILKAVSSSCSAEYTRVDNRIVQDFIDSLLDDHQQLLRSKSSSTVSFTKFFIEQLRFWKNLLICKRQEGQDLDDETINLLFFVVGEAGIVKWYSWNGEEKGFEFSNWIEKVQLLNENLTRKYPETSIYKFPGTNGLGFMDGLLEDLKELIRYNHDSIALEQGQLDVARKDLVFLRDFLQDIVKQHGEQEELKALWFRIVDAAYRFEFVIYSLVVGNPSPDSSPTSFNTIKEEIKKIKDEVKEIYVGKKFQTDCSNTAKIFNRLPSASSNPTMDEVMVGFQDEATQIIDRLEGKAPELDIVSIVGMPGQGKTTLAKKMYNEIKSHFHVYAWCCITQEYQKRELLIDILIDIGKLPTDATKKSDEDLEGLLYKSLKGRKYLIVLDDIWDIEAWQCLKLSFPNDDKRSRILLTSRIRNVALQIKSDSNPHLLRLLNDDESKQLLQNKFFLHKGSLAELAEVEMQIVESCKGLPFAVVTVAGLLANTERDKWKDLSKVLSTVSGTDRCLKLLELSYMHLPEYLKPCLLYFGSLLEDEEVPVSRLTTLWVAEGFVQKTTHEKSSENVAEDYLIDLINRSLVMVVKHKSIGGMKACIVHDLVHEFCTTRAREENFLQILKGKTDPLSVSAEPYRLCIYPPEDLQCFRHLSSLKVFRRPSRSHDNQLSQILRNARLLKVLDLRGIACNQFPSGVETLYRLRFLALFGAITYIPSTIDKLWNLETFLINGSQGEVTLPQTLLSMTKLRHLQVNKRVVFSLPENNLENCCESGNLETFSTPLLSSEQDMVKVIRKMPNLQKLKCIFFASGNSKGVYQFPALHFLSRLESLKVHSTFKVPYQLELSFPENLKKLALSNFYLSWASISTLAQLPNLEVLKLLNRACEGETWDMEEEQVFKKHHYLKFENLGIVHWDASSYNFPRLRKLILHKCGKLQGIPSDVEEIVTLEFVEVKYCHHAVVTWAQDLEEVKEGLKVIISPVGGSGFNSTSM